MVAHILSHGHMVLAIDSNSALLQQFQNGEIVSTEPGVADLLEPTLRSGQLQLTGDYARVAEADTIIVCIPLLVDDGQQIRREPFLQCIESLAPHVVNNMLLMIETSVPVGFCRKDVQNTFTKAGKIHGRDYLLAASPERIKSGTMLAQLAQVPRAIGGLDELATKTAMETYRLLFQPNQLVALPSAEAAEFTKLAGMIYRDVNIALSNQLAVFAQEVGLSLVDLIPLINADGEAGLLQPGIGVGGHCTPVYPYFMMQNFREAGLSFTLAAESRRINETMAAYAWSRLKEKRGIQKVLILGLAFRPGVREDALSVAYTLRKVLQQDSIQLQLHDPYYEADEIAARGFEPCIDIYTTDADALVLVTMHPDYQTIDWEKMKTAGIRGVLDGRNQLDKAAVEAAGLFYIGIGRC